MIDESRFSRSGREVLVGAQSLEPLTAEVARRSQQRKRIPMWVLPVLAFLPIYAVLYAQSLSEPPATEVVGLALGNQVYGTYCSGCHSPNGSGGGAPRKLRDGEVLATFPDIAQQLEWVQLGSKGYDGVYGDPNRPGGARRSGSSNNVMTGFANALTDEQLLAVVRHEREVLSAEPGVKVDSAGDRLWPDGKPMLNDDRRLVWPNGDLMFDDEGRLRPKDG